MKKFKYNYKKSALALLIAGVPIGVACIIVNVIRLVKNYADYSPYQYVSFGVVILLSIAYLVLATAIFIDSSYFVTDKNFVLKWGLLKNEIPLESITRISYCVTTDKLAVYYGNEEYLCFNAKSVKFDELADEIRAKNKKVIFEMVSDENDEGRS